MEKSDGSAIEIAKSAIDSMQPGEQMAIVQSGAEPKVIASLTDDPNVLREALGKISSFDGQSQPAAAVQIASSLVANRRDAKVVFITDGVFEEQSVNVAGGVGVKFVPVGKTSDNVGIVALNIRKLERESVLFVGVRNFSKVNRTVPVKLLVDDNLWQAFELELSPGKLSGRTFANPPNGKVVKAIIEPQDKLKLDNEMATALGKQGQIACLLVSPGNPFLEAALALDTRLSVDKSAELPEPKKLKSYDIIILEGGDFSKIDHPFLVSFGAEGSFIPGTITQQSGKLTLSASMQSGILNQVSLEGVLVDKWSSVQLNSPHKVLARSPEGECVVQQDGSQRIIHFGFNLLDSDLPLRPDFPILLSNIVELSMDGQGGDEIRVIKIGQRVSYEADDKSPMLVELENSESPYKIEPLRSNYFLRNLSVSGVYKLKSGKISRTLIVQPPEESELNIAPVAKSNLSGNTSEGKASSASWKDQWWWFAVVSLAILSLEWWVYAKKS